VRPETVDQVVGAACSSPRNLNWERDGPALLCCARPELHQSPGRPRRKRLRRNLVATAGIWPPPVLLPGENPAPRQGAFRARINPGPTGAFPSGGALLPFRPLGQAPVGRALAANARRFKPTCHARARAHSRVCDRWPVGHPGRRVRVAPASGEPKSRCNHKVPRCGSASERNGRPAVCATR
jgi:hypothetical protein